MLLLLVAIAAIAPQAIWLFQNFGGITWDQKPDLIPWWFYLVAVASVLGAIILHRNDLAFFSIPLLGLVVWQFQQILDTFRGRIVT